jgi:hypothetical protein
MLNASEIPAAPQLKNLICLRLEASYRRTATTTAASATTAAAG